MELRKVSQERMTESGRDNGLRKGLNKGGRITKVFRKGGKRKRWNKEKGLGKAERRSRSPIPTFQYVLPEKGK